MSSPEIRIDQVPMQLMAAVRGRANAENVGPRIRELFDQLYAFLRRTKIQSGQNVVLYSNLSDKNLFTTSEGVPIEVGVQVPAPFATDGIVICSATPEGVVATCAHFGPYDQLARTHKAIHTWSRANNRQLAGPCWEVYGDWSEDPAQLRTDVFYLLK
jgi:effector-binding domain-containing protein